MNILPYIAALEKVLAELPEKGHLLTLREYALDDRILLHKMIFRFLDFSYAETVYLLKGLIIYQQRWGDLNEIAKEGIREVSTVLMRRAREYQQSGDLVKAMEMAFAILVTVEPEKDPEDLVYYAIVMDVVGFITELEKDY
ncbi:hypothetical protein [Pedobacter heparinus]|uniref:Uncharacterized protein n=1 Tax=Pedobacter heparinus (strain ATCC 13125 / DSM 2366 / CIP 104194 / JCM 7457 / NBRC 12017 / NCIMB 9290 / NRRL B-14731 / HIM 762-3) TaxID=485917 RepID=C6XWR1_PEDHD|nr:hypothetical protein [Pedobacter heparinus]ACU04205.1 hypothetical protein Phep_1998 [Pedobacter heparinus DSM 2366]